MGRSTRRTLTQLLVAGGLALSMVVAFVAVGGFNAGPHTLVFANGNHTGNVRPGWGCGDQNHTHTGPPGNPGMASPCGTSTSSAGALTSRASTSTNTSSRASRNGRAHKGSKQHHSKHASHKKHSKKKH